MKRTNNPSGKNATLAQKGRHPIQNLSFPPPEEAFDIIFIETLENMLGIPLYMSPHLRKWVKKRPYIAPTKENTAYLDGKFISDKK